MTNLFFVDFTIIIVDIKEEWGGERRMTWKKEEGEGRRRMGKVEENDMEEGRRRRKEEDREVRGE